MTLVTATTTSVISNVGSVSWGKMHLCKIAQSVSLVDQIKLVGYLRLMVSFTR